MRDSSKIQQNISRNGMPLECQKLIPYVVNRYREGKSKERIKDRCGKRNRSYVEEIYKRTESTIKNLSLDKITPIMGVHRETVKHGTGFVDTILRYCISYRGPGEKLEKKLLNAMKTGDKETNEKFRNFIKEKYKNEKINKNDIYIIKSLSKNQKFYLFVAENIIFNQID